MLQFTKDDIMHWIEVGVMSLLAILVLLLGVGPMLRRIMTPPGGVAAPGGRRLVGPTGGVVGTVGPGGVVVPAAGAVNITGGQPGSITSTGGANISLVGGDEAVAISNRTSAMIDIAQVQGQGHAQPV